MDAHKARVNGGLLAKYIDCPVVLVGELKTAEGTDFVLAASDGAEVQVSCDRAEDMSKYVEVTGPVTGDNSMSAWTISNLGDKFDLEHYNTAVKLMQQIPGPFAAPS